jgi:dihydroorotate dehydrogenase (fumarate)
MIDCSTSYMGIKLKNPLIVGSSGLTRNLANLIEIEKRGAGAVVLKSLFEEQIKNEIRNIFSYDDISQSYTEAEDYIRNYARTQTIEDYLNLITQAKNHLSIPVIASINCVTSDEWTSFAREIEKAGADALELNIFAIPVDVEKSAQDYEKVYFDIIDKVTREIKIPVSLKISYHFSGLADMIKRLSWTEIKGLVLFNRFYNPDIDIEKFTLKPGNLYSTPAEISTSLRWIAIMADRVQADLCASTGVHDGAGLIKQILAGARAVQVCSVLYKNGLEHISLILKDMRGWMEKNNFQSIEDFRGKLSLKKSDNPAVFHRVQFMKHFAGIE